MMAASLLFTLIFCTQTLSISSGSHGRLGEQSDPSVETDALNAVPQPLVFYEEFVKENKPVVFRSAVKNSRAYKYWTEDYLVEQYGNLTVRLESRSEQSNHIPNGTISLGLDLIGNFIKHYQSMDSYVISQIPEPMEKDVLVPPCLRCGSFTNAIQEVHLFLSASGGKTALHKDPYNNIHCIFNGTKDWILIHPNQTKSVYMSTDSQFEWGGISDIDVDNVDLEMYPKIAEIDYSKLRLYKGDCIFMPSGYWHQVRSFGQMNSAVAIWFSTLDSFDRTGCDGKRFDFVPMNTVPILWRYPGFGNLTQGHMDIYILKRVLLLWADEKTGKIDLTSFVNQFFVLLDRNSNNDAMINDLAKRKNSFVRYFGSEINGYTTKEFVNALTIDKLKELVEIIHPNDLSNTDALEYGHLRVESIEEIIMESLYEDGTFDTTRFLELYTKGLGGTTAKGLEIIRGLGIPKNNLVSRQHILDRIQPALNKYLTALLHDSATEKELFKFLKHGKRTTVHDEL